MSGIDKASCEFSVIHFNSNIYQMSYKRGGDNFFIVKVSFKILALFFKKGGNHEKVYLFSICDFTITFH